MSDARPKNAAASAYAKLKNIATVKKCNLMHLLIRYAMERFLYRLSVSEYAKQFVLKGGNLFVIWQKGETLRPTIDSDFLYFGNPDPAYLKSIFVEICDCTGNQNDGIRFDTKSLDVSTIREETEYGGTRIVFNAYLGTARIRLQFDIGIGDTITPPAEWAEFPVLLKGDIPRLRIYPKETAIAEKFETMVSRGMLNSRMKDFYDIWLLTELFDFTLKTLQHAVINTFSNRHVSLPIEPPDCFTDEFCFSPIKQTQWNAFCQKNELHGQPDNLADVMIRIKAFLLPVLFPAKSQPLKWHFGKDWN
ncbi:MAG: nucleotidyl transferase AbiEii/AbiGii toxin family protein [bacterium]